MNKGKNERKFLILTHFDVAFFLNIIIHSLLFTKIESNSFVLYFFFFFFVKSLVYMLSQNQAIDGSRNCNTYTKEQNYAKP